MVATGCALALHLLPRAGWIHDRVTEWLTGGEVAAIAGEMATTAVILFLPAAAMGATFSHLAQASAKRRGVGWALALNNPYLRFCDTRAASATSPAPAFFRATPF